MHRHWGNNQTFVYHIIVSADVMRMRDPCRPGTTLSARREVYSDINMCIFISTFYLSTSSRGGLKEFLPNQPKCLPCRRAGWDTGQPLWQGTHKKVPVGFGTDEVWFSLGWFGLGWVELVCNIATKPAGTPLRERFFSVVFYKHKLMN